MSNQMLHIYSKCVVVKNDGKEIHRVLLQYLKTFTLKFSSHQIEASEDEWK